MPPIQHALQLDHELVSVEDDTTVHAMLELTAAEVDTDRPPLRLAVVIDRSGSMAGDRLETAKEATAMLADRLAADDQLAVVAYDDQVRVLAPLTTPGPQTMTRVAHLGPGGTTNLSGGWGKARELLAHADHTRRVVLLTDGHANVGITDPDQLAAMARTAAATGITTTSIGIGANFNEQLLATMADRAGGGYFHASHADELADAFAEAFADLAALVANGVSVEIRPSGDAAVLEVLNDFPVDDVDGGLQIQVGELHATQTRRVVWRLRVPSLAQLGPTSIAEVVLRWTAVGDEVAHHTTTLPLVVNAVSAEDAAAHSPDAVVTDEVLVLSAAKEAEALRRKADAGEASAAAARMRELAGELDAYAHASAAPQRLHTAAERYRATADQLQQHWSAEASMALHEDLYRQRRSRPERPS